MVFRHFSTIFNEINRIKQSKLYVDTKLVFSDGSLLVHSSELEARGLWWATCQDPDIPPEEITFLLPDYSITYGKVLAHGLYEDSDVGENGDNGDNVLHDDHDLTEQSFNILHECYDIPKLTVRPPVIQRNNEHEAIVCDEVTDCSPSNQAPAGDSQAGEGGNWCFISISQYSVILPPTSTHM